MFQIDLKELFDDDLAAEMLIDGVKCQCIPGQLTIGPSDYDGVVRYNWQLTTEAKNLAGVVPTQKLIIDGSTWKVESINPGPQITDVYLSKRAT